MVYFSTVHDEFDLTVYADNFDLKQLYLEPAPSASIPAAWQMRPHLPNIASSSSITQITFLF